MDIAVVILNWNGRELLERFLPSVVKFSKGATVYVADNASTDASVTFISENFPTVTIIRNVENGGYAKGYNDALKHVSEDIFVLLNNDVEVTENWIEPICAEFERNFDTVAAQPKILDYKNREYFEYAGAAGGFIDKFGYPFCRGRIFDNVEKDIGQYNGTSQIFWASGACLFVRADSFWQVGGFDEDYFAHQEEIDLCWRLNNWGGKVLFIGGSKVFHLGGATLSSANPGKTFYNFRNSLLNLFKNVGGLRVFPIIFLRLLLDGLAGIMFLTEGRPSHVIAVVRAHFSFYGSLRKFNKKRRKWARKNNYFYIKSIVFQFFINKKKVFDRL